MKSILVISNYFPPEMGAASNRIFEMCHYLKKSNYDVEVACPFPNYPTGKVFTGYKGLYIKENIENITVHRLWILADKSKNPIKRGLSMISFSLSLWILTIKENLKKYDIIYIQNSPLLVSSSSIVLLNFLFKKKIVLNVSDLWPQSAIDLGIMKKNSMVHKFFKMLEKFNYSNSEKIVGQSEYILKHISNFSNKRSFLYKNIPTFVPSTKDKKYNKLTFIYAGLFGVAQGVLNLVKEVSKVKGNYEFHLYGEGNEKDKIINYLKNLEHSKIKYFGSVAKEKILTNLNRYQYAFVPLAKDIKGAFPSKIYELVSYKVPIIYIGGGEAKKFIEENKIGYAINPKELKKVSNLIKNLLSLSEDNYLKMVNNCNKTTLEHLNFKKQFESFLSYLNE